MLITLAAAAMCFAADADPYLWMEEVENEKALAWAKERAEADTAVFEAVPVDLQLLAGRRSRPRCVAPHLP
jgi:hypothetical protein